MPSTSSCSSLKTNPAQRLRQLLIPIIAWALALIITPWINQQIPTTPITPFPPFLIAGGIALLISRLIKNPWWWHLFHGLIFPATALFIRFEWSPSNYLWALLATLLVFSGVIISRVPLYFSGHLQIETLISLIKPEHKIFIDLGAGIGSAIIPIARQFPHLQIVAYEIAPMTYLTGRLRSLGYRNIQWKLARFESADISQADIVYAFLSTEPMPTLWQKIEHEMKPGSQFISNSFMVPEIETTEILLSESIHPLYIYSPSKPKRPL